MNRIMLSVGGLAIALVILVAVNVLAGFGLRGVRADMTESKLYTLSPASKKILSQIDEPITLRLFETKALAEKYLSGFNQRVGELLIEYKNASHGKLKLEILEPEQFSEVEDMATEAGVTGYSGAPLAPGEKLYFGLAGSNTVGNKQAIGFIEPSKEEFLEYDLTKLVYSLAHPSKLVLGVLSTLPIEGGMPNPMQRQPPQAWYIMDAIHETYETKTIQPNATEIPKDVTVLMVVHPKNLSDATLYAIDQFVLGGGKALVFVDPYCDNDQPPQDPNNPMAQYMAQRGSGMPKLFDAWGVQMPPDKIAADRKNALPIPWNGRNGREMVNYVAFLGLSDDDVNKSEVPTSQLKRINMAMAGILEPKGGATTTFTPLIETSQESMEIPTSQIQFSPDPSKMLADFFPSGKKMTLAARITGPAKTAFAGGKPAADPAAPPEAKKDAEGPHLSESNGAINVIVVSDADMLSDPFWVNVVNFAGQRIPDVRADNGAFVMNALDFLHGSTDMVTLRARGRSSYPFLVVQELQRSAEQSYRAEEQKLVDERGKTEKRLDELLSKKEDANATLMSPEAQAEISKLRDSMVATNKRLREVRHDLNKDIEWLGVKLKFLNVAVVPGLVLIAALLVFVYRQNRRKLA